jgi:hypothetical protein
MAKELLMENFYSEKDRLSSDWNVKVEVAKLNGQTVPEHPSFPTYPTEIEIISKASTLNGFVSNTTVDKPTKKST